MKEQQSGTLAAMFLTRQALGLNEKLSEIKQFDQIDKVYFPNQKEAACLSKFVPTLFVKSKMHLAASYRKFVNKD